MEAKIFQSLHLLTCTGSEKIVGKPSGNSLRFSLACGKKQRLEMHVSSNLEPSRPATRHRPIAFKVSSGGQQFPVYAASVLESGNLPSTLEEDVILKNKSEDIEPHLSGRCIYLVGMMGSGKTTVGKILSEGLGYDFVDCDFLIEKAVGEMSVAEIFKLRGESFFRKNETEVIRQLSQEHRLVISTGGGAVVRPINWKFMHKGISVWLDVPLEALARRITAVGTDSRPLLQKGSGDAYEKTFKRLSALLEERGEAYANANARVSLENIAVKLGYEDVCHISPTMIAIEALVQIERFLKK